jgi:hypothetical protein
MLDQEPVISVAAAALAVMSHPHQYPAPLQLFARERELQVAFAKGVFGISTIIGGPEAPVPKHDGTAPVLALRDRPFEVPIVEWVILDLHGKSPVARVKRGALRDSPRLEDTVHLKAQIVV